MAMDGHKRITIPLLRPGSGPAIYYNLIQREDKTMTNVINSIWVYDGILNIWTRRQERKRIRKARRELKELHRITGKILKQARKTGDPIIMSF